MAIVKINGTTLPDPTMHDLTYSDIHSPQSGRNVKGVMIIQVVRSGVRSLSLQWANVSQDDAKKILQAISGTTFTVTYNDPITGTSNTFTAYKGDRSVSPYMMHGTKESWIFGTISVDLVEV